MTNHVEEPNSEQTPEPAQSPERGTPPGRQDAQRPSSYQREREQRGQERTQRMAAIRAQIERITAQTQPQSEKELVKFAETILREVDGDEDTEAFENFGLNALATLVHFSERQVSKAIEDARQKYKEGYSKLTRLQRLVTRLGLRSDVKPSENLIKRNSEPAWASLARNRLVVSLMGLSREELETRLKSHPSGFEEHAIHKVLRDY